MMKTGMSCSYSALVGILFLSSYFTLGCDSAESPPATGRRGELFFSWPPYVGCEDGCRLGELSLSLSEDPDFPSPPFMPPTWLTISRTDAEQLPTASTIESSDEAVFIVQEQACGVTEATPYNFDGVDCGAQESSRVLSAAVEAVALGRAWVRLHDPDGNLVDEYELEVVP